MTTGSRSRLRADARRNRELIIAAAATAFAEDGPSIPMEEIARLAGVGVGTLYRHFPDREALVLAAVQSSMNAMLAMAREAATTAVDAREAHARDARERGGAATDGWMLDALVRAMSGFRELRLTMRISELFPPTTAAALAADPSIRQIRDELVTTIEGLVRAAQDEGSLRPDVGTGDVIQLFSLLLRDRQKLPAATADVMFLRARALVLDGLRTRPGVATAGSPLPGHPLTAADLDLEPAEAQRPGAGPADPERAGS